MFGEIVDGEMRPNLCGAIAAWCWDDLPAHYPAVELDAFAIMPNHVHGIIVLAAPHPLAGAGFQPTPTDVGAPQDVGKPLSEIVRAFKTFSARRINEARDAAGVSVWQRGYYDHIIRNERVLVRIRQYIEDNPARWVTDQLHPENPSKW